MLDGSISQLSALLIGSAVAGLLGFLLWRWDARARQRFEDTLSGEERERLRAHCAEGGNWRAYRQARA